MRLFVALVCVSLVAMSSAQLSLRGRLGRSANVNLAVQQPTLLAKTAGIVPSVLVKNAGIVPSVLVKNSAGILPSADVAADVQTPSILPQVSTGNYLPYYPRYWPDYGSSSGGWYPGGWNAPNYWNNDYYDYGTPYLARRRFLNPVVSPVVSPAVIPAITPAASSSSSSTTTTTTSTSGDNSSDDSNTVNAAVVPEQDSADSLLSTQVI
ncbi:uncharacterized protein LOC108104264 [Drosophila eugracilis]|uniref:uncharacterized protein LOC108104264 n=1 Tax=Drosophila eugracilis TaxID=29029 RepID=UPI0007E7C85A|nr:uncharacterized protein LOC108104264 [Drosophila eugracilis]